MDVHKPVEEGSTQYKTKDNRKYSNTKPKPKPKVTVNEKRQKEDEFNCNECDFQGTSNIQLKKHFDLKHNQKEILKGSIACRNCGEMFNEKWNLMNHRKNMHSSNVATCRNFSVGKCNFSAELCWWKHEHDTIITEDSIKCFICNEVFKRKAQMMLHRKQRHSNIVRHCNLFKQNICRFQRGSCWYLHEEINNKMDDHEEEDGVENESDFRKAAKHFKPPIRKENKKEKME